MNDDKYERTLDELKVRACKWWPDQLREEVQKISVLQTLLDSQEKFISILKLVDKYEPSGIFNIINAANFPYPLFLKHLVVLTDIGGEPLQRINKDFDNLFPDGKLVYNIGDGKREYVFSALPIKGNLTNKRMKIDTVKNLSSQPDDVGLYMDIIMILMYGSSALDETARVVLYKCVIHEYLNSNERIEDFVRKNYIRVSSIIGGRMASDLGNAAQKYAMDYLRSALGDNYNIKSNGTVPGVTTGNSNKPSTFDIVVDRIDDASRHKKYVAIEVSFQETSNSTIERKSGQAESRFEKITATRNFIAYIIDGVGNFSRTAAVSVLCTNSHCTVAYTQEEFNLLVEFIKEKIG